MSAEANVKKLQEWQQGDFVLGDDLYFVFVDDLEKPENLDVDEGPFIVGEQLVKGLVVVSQTCDVVRDPSTHPFVELCPLREVQAEQLASIQKFRRPGFAFIPGAAELELAADLNRTMTVKKSVLTAWERKQGCSTDEELCNLQFALARKRNRFAFPDEFNERIGTLQNRFKSKHGKNTDEGKMLRSLDEIRVTAVPSWSAPKIDLTFWFIRGDDCTDPETLLKQVDMWMEQFEINARYIKSDWVVCKLEDMNADEYRSSDLLDLDYLSISI